MPRSKTETISREKITELQPGNSLKTRMQYIPQLKPTSSQELPAAPLPQESQILPPSPAEVSAPPSEPLMPESQTQLKRTQSQQRNDENLPYTEPVKSPLEQVNELVQKRPPPLVATLIPETSTVEVENTKTLEELPEKKQRFSIFRKIFDKIKSIIKKLTSNNKVMPMEVERVEIKEAWGERQRSNAFVEGPEHAIGVPLHDIMKGASLGRAEDAPRTTPFVKDKKFQGQSRVLPG